jgi:4-alpha-glucanotransferase
MHPEMMRRDGYRYAIAYIRNHLRFAKLLRIDHVMGLHRLYWIPEGLKAIADYMWSIRRKRCTRS